MEALSLAQLRRAVNYYRRGPGAVIVKVVRRLLWLDHMSLSLNVIHRISEVMVYYRRRRESICGDLSSTR